MPVAQNRTPRSFAWLCFGVWSDDLGVDCIPAGAAAAAAAAAAAVPVAPLLRSRYELFAEDMWHLRISEPPLSI
jgi:hypothetical protein